MRSAPMRVREKMITLLKSVLLQQELQQIELLRRHHRIESMRHRLRRRTLAADLDLERIAQRPTGELFELGRQRRREEQRLPILRTFLHDAFHIGQEAHVEHPVDFVEHEDVDIRQRAVALLQMVQQAPRRRRQDVHTATQIVLCLP
jgi:hypothetical protein